MDPRLRDPYWSLWALTWVRSRTERLPRCSETQREGTHVPLLIDPSSVLGRPALMPLAPEPRRPQRTSGLSATSDLFHAGPVALKGSPSRSKAQQYMLMLKLSSTSRA